MAKKSRAKAAKKRALPRKKTAKRALDPLLARVTGAELRDVGHVRLEVGRAGAARVKRMIYPAVFQGCLVAGAACSSVRPTAVPRLKPFHDDSKYALLSSSPLR